MRRVIKYSKVFVIMFLIAGIPFGLIFSIKVGPYNAIMTGFYFGLAIAIASIRYILHDYTLTKNLPIESLNLAQHAKVSLKCSFEDLRTSIQSMHSDLAFIKKVDFKDGGLVIDVYTIPRTFSHGEKISIIITKTLSGVDIDLTSKCLYSFMVLDYGYNYLNIQILKDSFSFLDKVKL